MSLARPNPALSHNGQRYSAKRKRTHHRVNFFCNAPEAKSVWLVGDFNDWDSSASPMRRMPDGGWVVSLELPHGHHRYLFVVDGRLTLDPNAAGVTTKDDHEASLIAVS